MASFTVHAYQKYIDSVLLDSNRLIMYLPRANTAKVGDTFWFALYAPPTFTNSRWPNEKFSENDWELIRNEKNYCFTWDSEIGNIGPVLVIEYEIFRITNRRKNPELFKQILAHWDRLKPQTHVIAELEQTMDSRFRAERWLQPAI